MKKYTVTIGIPAYYSEDNIKKILKSLLNQKEASVKIEKILVYVDGCKDKTAENAKSIKSKTIEVIGARKNRGYAYSLGYLIKKNTSDIFVGLNDDIRIDSDQLIENLVKPFKKNRKVGLVGGNIQALRPETFVGRCIYTSYLAFLPLRNLKNGRTHLTCDGKIIALSRAFAETLKLTDAPVGNADIFIYFENLRQKRAYEYADNAKVFFRLPESIHEFRNQESRSLASQHLIKKYFGYSFDSNLLFPKKEYIKSVLQVFLKHPLESVFFKLFINRRVAIKNKHFWKWRLAFTTKKLALLFFTDGQSFTL